MSNDLLPLDDIYATVAYGPGIVCSAALLRRRPPVEVPLAALLLAQTALPNAILAIAVETRYLFLVLVDDEATPRVGGEIVPFLLQPTLAAQSSLRSMQER